MSRRRAATKREVLPDHQYKDITLTKFMNRIMLDGKKSVSERIVYGAFDIVFNKTNKKPIEFFHEALNNIKPSLEVRSRRVGGATYQVPMEVRPRRAQTLAMKWCCWGGLFFCLGGKRKVKGGGSGKRIWERRKRKREVR